MYIPFDPSVHFQEFILWIFSHSSIQHCLKQQVIIIINYSTYIEWNTIQHIKKNQEVLYIMIWNNLQEKQLSEKKANCRVVCLLYNTCVKEKKYAFAFICVSYIQKDTQEKYWLCLWEKSEVMEDRCVQLIKYIV